MKKVTSFLNKVLLLSLLVAVPVMFYGQNTTTKKDKKSKKNKTTTTSFTPHFFLQGDFGSSWSWTDVSATHVVPDLRKHVFNVNGDIGLGYQFNNWMNVYGNFNRGFVGGRIGHSKTTGFVNQSTGAPLLYTGHNLLFNADYFATNLDLGFNMSNVFAGYKNRKFFVGAHVGIGEIQWKSKLMDAALTNASGPNAGKLVTYTAYGYKKSDYSSLSPSAPDWTGTGINDRRVNLEIPIGVNLNYKINDTWTVYGDYTYTALNTDLFDGGVVKGGNDAFLKANLGLRLNLNSLSSGTHAMVNKFNQGVKMTATPNPMVKKGPDIKVDIKGSIAPKYFSKKAVMLIQPVMTYEGGKMLLKPIVLKGQEAGGEGQPINYADGGSFNYSATIPYKKGMEVAELHAAPVIYTYSGQDFTSAKQALASGRSAMQVPDRKLDDGTIITASDVQKAPLGAEATKMAPIKSGNGFVYKFAPNGYQKVTVKSTTSAIHFKIDVARLDWGLKLNRNKKNYDALKNNLEYLHKGWAVKGIEINGWASPDGPENLNNKLSGRRAETAKRYIESKIKRELYGKNNGFAFKSVKDVPITTVANGPDWNGFMEAVKNSDIKDRSAIVNVVSSQVESQRQSEIKKMIAVYPQIQKEILPELRRAVIKVNAFEPKKTDAEILKMATSPDYGQLSLRELLYAGTLTNDLSTKVEIYKNVLTKYPKCWRAATNAGAAETAMGNYDAAKSMLMKAENLNPKSAEAENNMGILQAKMGNYTEAVKSFTKAQELGANENYNLGIMNIEEGNYQEAVNLLSGYHCDYNLGLAQMLNGDNSAANSTLQCAPETANTDYLLAVLNAREGNKSETLSYLTRAIKMNHGLALKASQDVEFIKYFNEPDFKALVGSK